MMEKFQSLLEQLKDYSETRITLLKLETAKKVSGGVSMAVALFSVALLGFLAIFLMSVAAAWALGRWIDSMPLGFLIIGAVYALICVIIWKAKERILRLPVMNALIREFFTEKEKAKI